MSTMYVFVCAPKANRSLWISLCVNMCMCSGGWGADRVHRGAVCLVMVSLITSESHLAGVESAHYKSTNSCSLQTSSFDFGKGCVLSSLQQQNSWSFLNLTKQVPLSQTHQCCSCTDPLLIQGNWTSGRHSGS